MAETWKQWEGREVNGEFQLRQYLGGSDHSAVFLTERGGQEPQKAAIKLVPAKPDDPGLQLSWWGLAAKLSHPHLLRLFQTGRCQLNGTDLLYVVMEYAEEDLSQILPVRPLTPAESRNMLQPVLDVLAYLHGKGFVHGHIKPANIMAVGDQLKVSSDGLCGVGELSGVLGIASPYTPPEIANGGGISPSSDVWSLGMTLVEAATQHLPVWQAAETQDPLVPETLPAPFLDIVRHCLRRSPQLRWSVSEIATHLQPGSGESWKRKTASPQTAPANWRYWTGAAAGLALVAMLAGPRLLNRHKEAQPVPVVTSEPSGTQAETAPVQVAAAPEPSAKTASAKQHVSNRPVPVSAAKPATGTSTSSAVPGSVAQQVMPDVSRNARATIQGKVKVKMKVTVDSSGDVVRTKFVTRGPSRYFANKALQAAERWKFTPPQVDGQAVPSEWTLRFEFGRTETSVHPAQTTP
jgi:TonB family protein